MLLIDKYSYTNKLNSLDPIKKTIFAICILLMTSIIDDAFFSIGVTIVLAAILALIAKIPFIKYCKMFSIPLAFLSISILTIMISISSDSSIYIYSYKLWGLYIGITKMGAEVSFGIFFRVIASLSAMYFFALTTPINQQILVMKRFKIPNVIIELIVLVYRFIFIFVRECSDIYIAQHLRFGYKDLKGAYQSLALLIKQLFIRVLKRYEDMNIALEHKLFDGQFHL